MAKNEREEKVLNRKLAAREERERRQQRLVLLGAGGVVAVALLVVLVGAVIYGLVVPNQPVAVVNGEAITTREFQAVARYQRRGLVVQYLNTLDTMRLYVGDESILSFFQNSLDQLEAQLDPTTLGRETLNLLIEDRLIRQEAARLGITVSEAELDEAVDAFFGYFPDGTPTPTVSPTTAPTPGLSATQLALVTATPTREPTATPEGPEATSTPELPTATPAATATPFTEQAYADLYKQTVDNLKTDIRLSEKDLRRIVESQLYREKVRDALTADLAREEEQVWARHILLPADTGLATAEEIFTRLEAGEDFGELAREFSTDTGSAALGGDLGWFGMGRMVSEFETAAWALEVGEISEPVLSQFGYHIIQALGHEMRPLAPNAYENLRDTEFTTWLNTGREGTGVELREYWADRAPEDPSIPEGYAEQYLAQFIVPTPVGEAATATPVP